ncbi:thiol:disulfide interchange protein TlpA [Polymorphum gilvum]|uniref:Thioredoxin-like protein n=1 Tax=Polymorphum gilvum (strain LMG 25793 / CGMCC 1.9160 / SL003B-26A1) TaxID=991905 RepID=F2IZD9_POLGS|nr:TlpA disulfide reductase family protein [Polymorphum gilvum]ADZ68562.1 Thioredoxin-like protein [Polymorphum gilvum SL003B-26A1]
MTTPTNGSARSRRPLLAVGLVAVVAAVAGVYVIGGRDGNTGGGKSCAAALAAAAAVKPFATGEVAAFLPAQKPLALADLAFTDDAGKPMTIADFSGRMVLLNLWATWCAPCRKEMPALDRLQQQLGGENFEVVTVNLDRGGADKPKAFLAEIGVSNLAYYADPTNGLFNDLRAKARATGLPTTILVDPAGCEIGTMYGPAEWDSDEAKALIGAATAAAPAG